MKRKTKNALLFFGLRSAEVLVLICLLLSSSFSALAFPKTSNEKNQIKTQENEIKEKENKFKEAKLWKTPQKTDLFKSLNNKDSKVKEKAFSLERVIVKFKSEAVEKRDKIAKNYHSDVKEKMKNINNFVLDVPENLKDKDTIRTEEDVLAFVDSLKKDPNVEYAEPDYYVETLGQKKSWGFEKVKAEEAHTNNGVTGQGAIVAVIDTGVDYLHEDLSNNIWSNAGEIANNGIDDDGNGYVDDIRGWDFIGESVWVPSPDNDPMDGHGHGTHVSGIAAAEDNTLGVIGVAPKAKIMPVKVLDDGGGGFTSTVSDGILYAADNGAHILNMSLGTISVSRTLREAIKYATEKGALVVAAAGNNFSFNLYQSYPALYENVISVGALDKNDKKTWWSNWGKVDVIAPGEDILSSIHDDRYASWSGTSMAAPYVAGALALIKEKHPTFTDKKLRQVLESYTTDFYHSDKDYLTGWGLIDAELATGTLEDTLNLNTNKHRIVADNEDNVTITVRILDENGDPIQGEEVNFTSSIGTITGSPDTTNADGEATAILTANDTEGLATITAETQNYGSKKIEVVVFNDKVYIQDVRLMKTEWGENAGFFQGEKINLLVSLRIKPLLDFDLPLERKADLTYQVLDSQGNPVTGLSGSKKNISVGSWWWGLSKEVEIPVTLPLDMASGIYTLNVAVTDQESLKTDNLSRKFQVGQGENSILFIPSMFTWWGGSIDPYALDFGEWIKFPSIKYISAFDNLDLNYDIWPYSWSPSYETLKKYPVVVLCTSHLPFGNFPGALYSIIEYLKAGGNAFMAGNTDFVGALIFGEGDRSSIDNDDLYFSGVALNIYPEKVNGLDESIFDGLAFDIDAFNLSGDGAQDQMVADEIKAKVGAQAALKFPSGVNDPAVSGLTVDNGLYKLAYSGFGFEGINNNTGDNTREEFFGKVFDYFKPVSISISSVSPSKVDLGKNTQLTILGSGFVQVGTTQVKVGGIELENVVVVDRNTIQATLPATFPAVGTYSLTVKNPFGQKVTKQAAIKVVYPAPVVKSVSPKSGSNEKARTISIFGSSFRSKAKVYLGTKTLSNITVHSSSKITATIPKGFPVGLYSLKVTNPDGKYDILSKAYRVVYPAPKISSLSPLSGSNEKARTIAIFGSSFRPQARVYLGTKKLSNIVVHSSSKITATIPKGFPVSLYSLKVTNPDGKYDTLSDAYRVISVQPTLIVGLGPEGEPEIRAFDRKGNLSHYFFAFPLHYKEGVKVATGDIDGDGKDEIVAGTDIGGASHIKIFNRAEKLLNQFFTTYPGSRGVNLATGDINKDGKDEIIVGAGPGGEPQVRVFNSKGKLLLQFFAFDSNFRDGVNVAVGDLTGDGIDEIICGAGLGGGPHLRVFNSQGKYTGWHVFAFHQNFSGGVNVAAGDVDGDGKAEIGVCQASKGEAWCKVYQYNKARTILGEWLAYPEGVECGANLSMFDIDRDGKAEIITGAGKGGGPHIRAFKASGVPKALSFFAYSQDFRGGVIVAGGEF